MSMGDEMSDMGASEMSVSYERAEPPAAECVQCETRPAAE